MFRRREKQISNRIENEALVKIEACDGKVQITSNRLEVTPIKLRVEKKQDCDFALVGQNIKYTIEIENECLTDVEGLIFKDAINACTEFVLGSFRANGHPEIPEFEDDVLVFKIDEIKAGETLIITFEVKVTDDCCSCGHMPPLEQSTPPVISQVHYNHVNGTGIPYAIIYVKFPNEDIVSGTVNNGGNWNIAAPERLEQGQIVQAWQVEPGKAASKTVEKIFV